MEHLQRARSLWCLILDSRRPPLAQGLPAAGEDKVMSNKRLFPSLAGFEPTAKTLHLYAKAVAVVARAHAEPHPKWWHISLKVQPEGLATDEMRLPHGGAFHLMMDLNQHIMRLTSNHGEEHQSDMTSGTSSTLFGDNILEAVAKLGVKADYARERYISDEPRIYDPAMAERFFVALSNVAHVFEEYRATLEGDKGPVQFWSHGFDLSFEWFGNRIVRHESGGEIETYTSQLNLGFAPGDFEIGPYFYSNPWPFEKELLLDKPLPAGARWHTEGWEGTMMPYEELVDDTRAAERLKAYAEAVYQLSAPTLTA